MMIKLDNTDNNIENLLNMARELNAENGSEDWSDAFSLADDVDEYLADMKPTNAHHGYAYFKSRSNNCAIC